jgi:hypothetical protein
MAFIVLCRRTLSLREGSEYSPGGAFPHFCRSPCHFLPLCYRGCSVPGVGRQITIAYENMRWRTIESFSDSFGRRTVL